MTKTVVASALAGIVLGTDLVYQFRSTSGRCRKV
jgi:hypothetical protein